MTDLEELKALLKSTEDQLQLEQEWQGEIRKLCKDVTGGNTTFIDDDVVRTLRHLISRLQKAEARAEKAEGENAELKAALAPFSDEFRTNWSTYIPTYKSEILQLAIEDNVDVSLDAGGYAVEGLEDAVFTVEDLRTASRALGGDHE